MGLKGYGKLKKKELLLLLSEKWDATLDSNLDQDVSANDEMRLETQGQRTARTRITEQLKRWGSETLDKEIEIGFPVIVGRYGTKTQPIWGTVFGKLKVVSSSKTTITGTVLSLSQNHEKLPSIGELMTFEYVKAIPKSSKPTFYSVKGSAHVITPHDQDKVYKEDLYYGEIPPS